MNNTEIIRDRNKPPRLHVKPWDECVCSVMPLNTNRAMSLQPYQTADGYEYNWILTKKPERNIVQMAIETEGLEFLYQPALTLSEIAHGCHRPDNVIGSYAVYHKTMAGDYTAFKGGKNYMAGKAFHDYRPRPVDSKGNWCWGKLHYDIERGIRTVVIPWEFLEKATYPVYHAAGLEFGFHTVGQTQGVQGKGNRYLCKATSLPGAGNLTQISTWIDVASPLANTFTPALYSDNSGIPDQRRAYVNTGGTSVPNDTPAWTASDITYTLVASTQYWLGRRSIGEGDNDYYYDSGAGEMYYVATNATWESDASGYTSVGRRISIYGIYSPAVVYHGNMFQVM